MIGQYTGPKGELNFESDLVEMLISAGWSDKVIKNPSMKDLEQNFREIINRNNIEKIGTGTPLSDGEFSQIMNKIRTECTTSVAANILLNGKRVSITCEVNHGTYRPGDDMYLEIFDPVEIAGGKSIYQIAEQPLFETGATYNNRRGDILLLINGLPVIEIELKASGHSIQEACDQIQKYMNEGVYVGLMSMVQVFFVMTPEEVRYFANNQKVDSAFIFGWSDAKNHPLYDWKQFVQGDCSILSIPEAHQLIGYYTTASIKKDSNGHIENVNNGILMVARSYQIYAIRRIMDRVKIQRWENHAPLGGYVWGTTGCGKTLTSYKAAQLLIDRNYADKVVFLVDRIELSDQSFEEYNSFARDGEPIRKPSHTRSLFQMLSNDKDRLLITSIQKVHRIHGLLGVSDEDIRKINVKRIVFIVDEAHRSQFGEMHERMKNTFVNALFIGFTGTPIFASKSEKEGVKELTSETIFGECLAIYSIASGIRDKNVLGFYPKMVKTYRDDDLREALACRYANVKDVSEAKRDPRKWKIYQNWMSKDMLTVESRLSPGQYDNMKHHQAVVDDILEQWPRLSNADVPGATRFHALFATSSIKEAIDYYHLLKDSGLHVTALFDPNTNDNNAFTLVKDKAIHEILTDYEKMFPGMHFDRGIDPQLHAFKQDVTSRLSHKGSYKNLKPEDMLDIVIVVDQLLTGFDSKYINTLYLDKVLESSGLIQAISRTNRVLNFEEKPWGIFRYYRMVYTMEQNLYDALQTYCEGSSDAGVIVSDIDENIQESNMIFDEINQIFVSSGIQDFVSLPSSEASCQKFRMLFRKLKELVRAMKVQGMVWKDDNDTYVQQLKMCRKWIDGKHRLYEILEIRFDDLRMKISRSEGTGQLTYDIDTYVTEVDKEKIDADYLEEHFKQMVSVLLCDMDEMRRELAVQDFERQLGTLSQQQQQFAYMIITDIQNGTLVVTDETLSELLATYQQKSESYHIHEFATMYGLKEDLLCELYYKGEDDILIGRLLNECDRSVVTDVLQCSWLAARSRLNRLIREFVSER